jgi:serine protease Do
MSEYDNENGEENKKGVSTDRQDDYIDEIARFFAEKEDIKEEPVIIAQGSNQQELFNQTDNVAQQEYRHQESRNGGGKGWKIATLVLASFLAGALLMRYLPLGGSGSAVEPTALMTAVPAAYHGTEASDETIAPSDTAAPSATVPALGGTSVTQGKEIDIPTIAKAVGPCVVGVLNKAKGMTEDSLNGEVTQGSGSGVIITTDGYIVTNNHVISGADSVSVTLPGGKEVEAKIIGADEQTDLAVLKIDATGLTAAPIGNSDEMQVGQTVIAIGNPLGTELAGTVTAGILSARDRVLVVDGYKFKLFQTDAAINPGNSGGALVNTKGELIGINNLKSVSAGTDEYGQTISAEGIGFAIPVNDAMPVIKQLIADGYIPRPMLGIDSVQEITDRMASRYRVPVGILLRSLTQGGSAEKAGIRAGDILTKIDGKAVATLAEVNTILTDHKIGDKVQISIWRDNNDQTVEVTLEGNQKQ